MTKTRLDKLLSNLGYTTRKEAKGWIKTGRIQVGDKICYDESIKVYHNEVRVDGELLDPPTLTIAMYKPKGVICSHNESGKLIYSLLPHRWRLRTPPLSTIGRLDKDTTGLILLTDDGDLNHRLTSPKKKVSKRYQVTLQNPLRGDEVTQFASGSLMLKGDDKPCLPALLTPLDSYHAEVILTEGRYHQVKRMFEAVGNRVVALHRSHFGEFDLGELREGEFIVFRGSLNQVSIKSHQSDQSRELSAEENSALV